MSMTLEEAIEELERLLRHWDLIDEGIYDLSEHDKDAVEIAITALRPVSREKVEKVWRGEWVGDNDEKVGTIDGSPIKSSTCSVCGDWLVGSDEYDCSGYFCPACGRAMTDEAMEMVIERLEALKDDKDDKAN